MPEMINVTCVSDQGQWAGNIGTISYNEETGWMLRRGIPLFEVHAVQSQNWNMLKTEFNTPEKGKGLLSLLTEHAFPDGQSIRVEFQLIHYDFTFPRLPAINLLKTARMRVCCEEYSIEAKVIEKFKEVKAK